MNIKLEKQVVNKLNQVLDPELNISIIDMGLIYHIEIIPSKESKKLKQQNEKRENFNVIIKMTLTTIGCPLFSIIESQIKEKLLSIKGIKKINIKLVFDPPWTTDKMSEKARNQLGL